MKIKNLLPIALMVAIISVTALVAQNVSKLANGWDTGTVVPSRCSPGNSASFYLQGANQLYTCTNNNVYGLMTVGGPTCDTKGNCLLSGTIKVGNGQDGPRQTTIPNNTATALFDIAMPDAAMAGGQIFYTIHVTNGTDHQSHSGVATWAAVRKGAAITTSIAEAAQLENAALTGGSTLTDTWTMTTGAGTASVTLNANSNLAGITAESITYTLIHNDLNVLTYH
jgi:hypothetical protein